MPKFFVSSDIHSAYTPWMKALKEAGFDEDNEDHIIIVCGDLFDRMDESEQVYDWVCYMLQHNRLIYILGNHESLMTECIERGYPANHDWSNGTAKSIIDLAPHAENFYDACAVVYDQVTPLFNQALNYFETKNYIFVHGWIPVVSTDYRSYFAYLDDWRNASDEQWDRARWLNGMSVGIKYKVTEPNKTIVCGHWHTSWARNYFDNEKEFSHVHSNFDPYYADGIIAIDACTAFSNQINCIVIEDDEL